MDNYIPQILAKGPNKTIIATDVIEEGNLSLILGPPGSGKTTLCKFLYEKFTDSQTNSKNAIYPIYIEARKLDARITEEVLFSYTKQSKDNISFKQPAFDKEILFIIDGLDEISLKNFKTVSSFLLNFFQENSTYKVILTSRPIRSYIEFHAFSFYELLPIGINEVHDFVNKTLPSNLAKDFISTVKNNKVTHLITNPLLLSFVIRSYERNAAIPKNAFYLVEETIDYLLSTWDSYKNIGQRSTNNLGTNLQILSYIAYYLESADKIDFSQKNIKDLSFGDENIFEYFLQNGIFVDTNNRFSFAHKSFQEYFVAKYFLDYYAEGIKKGDFLHFNSQIFEYLLQSKQKEAIKNYVNSTSLDKKSTIFRLVDLIEIPSQNFNLSSSLLNINEDIEDLFNDENLDDISANTPTSNQEEDPTVIIETSRESFKEIIIVESDSPVNAEEQEDLLLGDWLALLTQKDRSKKGTQFEKFICNFLNPTFNIIDTNFLSKTGEFDLIVENTSSDPFWLEFHTDYIIECKNWSEKVDIPQVHILSQKVASSRLLLGFLVSVSGFTDPALGQFDYVASNIGSHLIVPITGKDIDDFFQSTDRDLPIFLKRLIRNIKLKRKY